MQKLGVEPGTGFRDGFEVGGECVCVGGARYRFRGRRVISFLNEAKQKGTVHRSVPQLLYIIFYRFLLRCRTRLIV